MSDWNEETEERLEIRCALAEHACYFSVNIATKDLRAALTQIRALTGALANRDKTVTDVTAVNAEWAAQANAEARAWYVASGGSGDIWDEMPGSWHDKWTVLRDADDKAVTAERDALRAALKHIRDYWSAYDDLNMPLGAARAMQKIASQALEGKTL